LTIRISSSTPVPPDSKKYRNGAKTDQNSHDPDFATFKQLTKEIPQSGAERTRQRIEGTSYTPKDIR
jgi:hypothetical protein